MSITQQSRTGKTRRSRAGIFAHWESFCQELGHDSLLSNVAPADRLSFLLAYGHKYRQLGKWSPRKTPKPVRAGTVDAALIAIGQGFTDLGRQDPRKAPGSDTLLPVYRDFIEGLRRNDGPQTRVYPVGLTFIKAMHEWLDFEDEHHGLFNHHVLQLTIIGFFWLMRPCEFLHSDDTELRTQAFEFKDITLTYQGRSYTGPNASFLNDVNTFSSISDVGVTFTDQKNGIKGEVIRQRATNHAFLCPAKAIAWILHHFHSWNAPPDTPLSHHYDHRLRSWRTVKYNHVTNALRNCASNIHSSTGVDPFLLTVKGLRPGGATSLLCAGVDSDAARVLGRWRSDAMLTYLRVQVSAVANHYSQRMLGSGFYTFPAAAHFNHELPSEAPAHFHSVNEARLLARRQAGLPPEDEQDPDAE